MNGSAIEVFEGIDAATSAVDSVAGLSQSVCQDMNTLRTEVGQHEASARETVNTLICDEDHHASELVRLADLSSRHGVEEAAADTTRCNTISELVEHGALVAAAAGRCRSSLEDSWKQVSSSTQRTCQSATMAKGIVKELETGLGSVREV